MSNGARLQAGDEIVKTLIFTLAAGEEASRITLLMTRTQAQSERSALGRSRCVVLTAENPNPLTGAASIVPAAAVAGPRGRYQAELRGAVPVSICGGSYMPVFCTFEFTDGRPATGFEIDADQRFIIEIADDAASTDSGPAINGFA
jgi:hypothetical protein